MPVSVQIRLGSGTPEQILSLTKTLRTLRLSRLATSDEVGAASKLPTAFGC